MGLFGGSKSKNKLQAFTSDVLKSINVASQKSALNSTASGIIKIKGNNNKVKAIQDQKININFTGSQINNSVEDIRKTLSNGFKQAAKSKGSGVLSALGASESNVETVIENRVKQEFTKKNLQELVTSINSSLELDIEGDNNEVDSIQNQAKEIKTELIQNNIMNMKIAQDISNVADTTAEAITTNPISEIIDSVFGGIAKIYSMVMLGFIVFIIFILILAKMFGKQLLRLAPTIFRMTPQGQAYCLANDCNNLNAQVQEALDKAEGKPQQPQQPQELQEENIPTIESQETQEKNIPTIESQESNNQQGQEKNIEENIQLQNLLNESDNTITGKGISNKKVIDLIIDNPNLIENYINIVLNSLTNKIPLLIYIENNKDLFNTILKSDTVTKLFINSIQNNKPLKNETIQYINKNSKKLNEVSKAVPDLMKIINPLFSK